MNEIVIPFENYINKVHDRDLKIINLKDIETKKNLLFLLPMIQDSIQNLAELSIDITNLMNIEHIS